MEHTKKLDEFLEIWKTEIKKFSKQNNLKVKRNGGKNLSYKRIAYFATECFFQASYSLNKRHEGTIGINKNIEYIESQVYTFAKKNSLSCEQIPHEKPLKSRQPNRKLIPWSTIGFTVVKTDKFIEEFLMDVFKIEENGED